MQAKYVFTEAVRMLNRLHFLHFLEKTKFFLQIEEHELQASEGVTLSTRTQIYYGILNLGTWQ